MITSINGLPGVGKNVYATALAYKLYCKDNSFIRRFIRKIKHEPLFINRIYSTYPICLDTKRGIYSNKVSPECLRNNFSFVPGASIFIDEIQSFYDSDEFKDFPKEIAVFNQFHRHFGIQDIYYISQHPSRIVKKLRNVISVYRKIRFFRRIPFTPFAFMYYTNYYEFEDYGKWHHPSRESQTYDVDNHFFFFNYKRVFKIYNSVYLHSLNDDKPLLYNINFNSTNLSVEDIREIFGKL